MSAPGYPAILRIIAPVALGTALAPLDSAVNVAFPEITRHFGQPVAAIQWIVICYVLTYGSLMLGIGRLGDVWGHGRVFRTGLAVSAGAFLLCAQAPSYEWLLACRVLQGIGAALVISCGAALATAPFAEAHRVRVLALYTTVFGAGSAIGPSIAGPLIEHFGWESVFWFRAPVALLALLLFRDPGPRIGPRETFDLLGAALLAATIGCGLLAVNQAHFALAEPWRPGLLALGFGLGLLAFLRRSRRVARPVMRLHYFASVEFALANIGNVLVNFAGFAVMLLVPYWLVRHGGASTGWSGVLLASSPAASMAAALVAGRLARATPQHLAGLGALLTGLGLLLVAQWGRDGGLGIVVLALALHGAGLGLFQLAFTDMVTGAMPREDRGVAGSLALMTRTLGVVGAASLLSLMQRQFEDGWIATGLSPEDAFLPAFAAVFGTVGLVPLGVAALWLLRGVRR